MNHLRAHARERPLPSRRDFERLRTDRRESDPWQGFRCC
ncbi:CstA-like transporter-associated (seleno)protein [Streptomyces graminofaciens]|nr:CstA-like transporter-associated (seleno)protein [Streptomyces graminofaciens]